ITARPLPPLPPPPPGGRGGPLPGPPGGGPGPLFPGVGFFFFFKNFFINYKIFLHRKNFFTIYKKSMELTKGLPLPTHIARGGQSPLSPSKIFISNLCLNVLLFCFHVVQE